MLEVIMVIKNIKSIVMLSLLAISCAQPLQAGFFDFSKMRLNKLEMLTAAAGTACVFIALYALFLCYENPHKKSEENKLKNAPQPQQSRKEVNSQVEPADLPIHPKQPKQPRERSVELSSPHDEPGKDVTPQPAIKLAPHSSTHQKLKSDAYQAALQDQENQKRLAQAEKDKSAREEQQARDKKQRKSFNSVSLSKIKPRLKKNSVQNRRSFNNKQDHLLALHNNQ